MAITRRLLQLREAQGGKCFHCLRPLTKKQLHPDNPDALTKDHVIPRSRGGENYMNLVVAHNRCNNKRGNAPLSEIDMRRAKMIIAAVVAKRGGW